MSSGLGVRRSKINTGHRKVDLALTFNERIVSRNKTLSEL
jgi:hypothetical protein